MAKKTLLATMTGEPFQPIRIYYDLFDRKSLLKKFNRLSCIYLDPRKGRWVWEYSGEAARLEFQKSRKDLPRESRDILLGTFHFQKAGEMALDVRSGERAVKAISFFDRHLPRSIARVTDLAVVNRFFDAAEGIPADFDVFFNRPDVVRYIPEELFERMEQLNPDAPDIAEQRAAIWAELVADAKRPLPEIERIPTNFYTDGIEHLQTALRMRFIITWEHWNGNTDFSFNDMLKMTIGAGVD